MATIRQYWKAIHEHDRTTIVRLCTENGVVSHDRTIRYESECGGIERDYIEDVTFGQMLQIDTDAICVKVSDDDTAYVYPSGKYSSDCFRMSRVNSEWKVDDWSPFATFEKEYKELSPDWECPVIE